MKILVYVSSTLRTRFRSGVQRVVVEIAKSLPDVVDVDFVKWDPIEGQLRYLDICDLQILFGKGARPIKPNPLAHRVQYRFGDTVRQPHDTWLLIPEISHHEPDGAAVFARILSQMREYDVRAATIFYDIIPITNKTYQGARSQHIRYVAELLRSDAIISISEASAKALLAYYTEELDLAEGDVQRLSKKIVPVLLPEINSETPPRMQNGQVDGNIIVMVGTVEPRKGQVEVLNAIIRLQAQGAISSEIRIHVFGSLHPFVASAFRQLVQKAPQVKYFDYAPASTIAASYRDAMFSVFASNDEGYGLPIAESIAHGVPCLTANFGAMAEVARGGGCLTCDVNDEGALEEAIRRLCTDRALRLSLRDQIKSRQFRDWSNYCQEIVELLNARREQAVTTKITIETAVREALACRGSVETRVTERLVAASDHQPRARLISLDRQEKSAASDDYRRTLTIFRFSGDAADVTRLEKETAERAFSADLWGVTSADAVQKLVDRARELGYAALLPRDVVEIAEELKLNATLASTAAERLIADQGRRSIAADERLFRNAMSRWRSELPKEQCPLAIVLSTYNRAAFVEANVSWLVELTRNSKHEIQIVVVDNASTDDTVRRLEKFKKHPHFRLVVNSQNVGMLGNLRICSTLISGQHVWLTGDDDFIVPEELMAVLDVLKDNPGLPLACVNFAVYDREKLKAGDQARTLIAEGRAIASGVRSSGIYPVNVVATQHDNIFTAIYPIIFRADLLAACFNYPFDGTPFSTLIESVPTTKWFLENYRYVECYWHAPVGIVGNAHNSWSHHRPRWHAVLMPQTFELARDAGADPAVLHRFAQLHVQLFDEAVAIAGKSGVPIAVILEDLAPARRVFRRDLSLPNSKSDQIVA